MTLLSIAQAIQSVDPFAAVRMSWYVYPIILTLHLCGIALLGGMVLMTDVRMLGWTMKERAVSDVVNQLRVPKRIFLGLAVLCGILLAGAKAEEYYYNPFFWAKISLLASIALHGLIFRGSVYRKVGEFDRLKKMPGRVKLAAGLSLLLWTGVACAGRGIGYIDPPLDKLHAENRAVIGLGSVFGGRGLGRR